ncbi:TolB-like translocation protein [Streptacidiphilus sp. N1-3]|uniref:TolB-like translocation protein n=1 Tax=Streptacidiphilus alkalitolerans TaxID=3342712 RepID=A0ABV6X2Z0_9ACTN
MTPLRRLLILAVAVLLLAGLGTGLVLHAASRAAEKTRPQAGGPAITAGRVTLDQPGRLLFVNAAKGPRLDEVVSVPAGSATTAASGTGTTAQRTASGLKCLRFYTAAGTGVCLQSVPGALTPSNRALIVDSDLHTLHTFPLAGTPSRARVSPSGHFAAWTVFVGGESYGAAFFSTRTSIVDTRTWRLVPSLESFAITLDGKAYHNIDVNFWGVTFAADDDTFYATLGTGGHTYLVRGSISRQTVTTLVQNVECPSLSPDGTRIAYKKRILAKASLWHEYVLDLSTLKETPLAEHHSVDDQATWLDDDTVAYALPTPGDSGSSDLWSVPADGTGSPHLLLSGAFSPAAPLK